MKISAAILIISEVPMLMQPLLDQLIRLHLPAFREGLQEQLHNPQYAELRACKRITPHFNI
jgi:hypothetical protein